MESLQPENPIANIDDGRGSVATAMDGLTKAGVALVERAAEIGLAENVAALYRDDPLEAEGAVRDMVFGMARSVLADAFAALDDHGPSLQVDGRAYRKAEVTPGHAMTMFGPVDFLRSRYRPSGHGASLVPAEAVLGLTSGGGGSLDVPDERPDGPRERGRLEEALRQGAFDGVPGATFRGGGNLY